MRSGFSLMELVVALLIFQVGLLAVVGLVYLAQQNLLRSEITLRGVLAAEWIADSLEGVADPGEGLKDRPWGEVSWRPATDRMGGTVVTVFSPLFGDTLVRLRALETGLDRFEAAGGPISPKGGP